MSEVARYTVSMEAPLLDQFDVLIEKRGYATRSEAVRDLIRSALVEEQLSNPRQKVAATVTLVYHHHASGLSEKLAHIQHHHVGEIVSTTHVHLDNDNCLEVVILRGRGKAIKELAEELVAIKGIMQGKAVFTTEGKDLC